MYDKILKYLIVCSILNFSVIFSKNYRIIKSNPLKISLAVFLNEEKKIFKPRSCDVNIKNNIKRIVIICPNGVSGGPENLCQMYASFKRLGFETYFLWINDLSKVTKKYEKGQWYLCKDPNNTINSAYVKDYQVNGLSCDIPLNKQTLIIIPEIWVDFVHFFEEANKAIAWLSISNVYYCGLSEVLRTFIEQKKLGDFGCIHMSQAPWVQKTLQSWGAEPIMIGDYISKLYFTQKKSEKTKNSIAFYPRKSGDLAKSFVKNCTDFSFIPLENLDQRGMIKALDSAKIYIDFGNFPGKDRVPREALLRDCIIFIHNENCATDFDSFPIDDFFRFTEEDISNGTLYKKIQEVLADYEIMKEKQNFMRNQVLQEPELFEQKIKDFIGTPLK